MYRELYIFVSHAKMIFQTNILELQKGLEIGIQNGVSQIKIELVGKSLKFYVDYKYRHTVDKEERSCTHHWRIQIENNTKEYLKKYFRTKM